MGLHTRVAAFNEPRLVLLLFVVGSVGAPFRLVPTTWLLTASLAFLDVSSFLLPISLF